MALQSALLVWRTYLTDYISRIEARAGRHLIAQVGQGSDIILSILPDQRLLSRICLMVRGAGADADTTVPVVLQQYPQFARLLVVFAGVAVPAACVNSGLKYFQKRIQLAFMRRLTHNLHQQYTANRAYYAASTLGGAAPLPTVLLPDVLSEACRS